MKIIDGTYVSAKIFADTAEDYALAQIRQLCSLEAFAGCKIRVMPDVHPGKVGTIGFTATAGSKLLPNVVGIDIGCGITLAKLKQKKAEFQKLDTVIRENIPFGFQIRKKAHRFSGEARLEDLKCRRHIHMEKALLSLGTLGGGNHFIEVDRGGDGALYLVIHSGSRHLGLEVAEYYQRKGYEALDPAEREQIPKTLAYVSGALFEAYIHDMKIIQAYARLNRQAMMDELVKGMKLHVAEQFTTVHNYIDTEAMILRKGAVSAKHGEKLLIPVNMRDGSLLCVGKGNNDWNQSAPHGAGRLMSRSAAKQSFTVSEFKKQMKGIYSTSIGAGTLDECPMAYKDMSDIVGNIEPTATIEAIIRPIYNFKAGDSD